MASIRRLKNGRYQADIRDTRRGIPRIKRTFARRKEAEEWIAAVRQTAHRRLLGHRERRLFGQALDRYLAEETPRKKAPDNDIENATILRWPAWDGRRWVRLEDTPLEDSIGALSTWLADMRAIKRRRYIDRRIFVLHPNPGGVDRWHEQPSPLDGDRPAPRRLVTDPALLAHLAEPGGRGPISTATLRIRQALVSSVLRTAWRDWDWLDENIASRIRFEPKARGRKLDITPEQLEGLVGAARAAVLPNGDPDPVAPHFADAILGAAWIGWRRGNVLGLEWPRVVFPVYRDKEELQPGVIWCEADHTKNGHPLAQPMSSRLERLLRRRWELRHTWRDDSGREWRLVFHRGDGRPFADFRRRWATAKRKAGIPASFVWHSLRHTWACHMAQSGVTDRHLQELGGWKDPRMVQHYSRLRVDHLRADVERPGNGNGREEIGP